MLALLLACSPDPADSADADAIPSLDPPAAGEGVQVGFLHQQEGRHRNDATGERQVTEAGEHAGHHEALPGFGASGHGGTVPADRPAGRSLGRGCPTPLVAYLGRAGRARMWIGGRGSGAMFFTLLRVAMAIVVAIFAVFLLIGVVVVFVFVWPLVLVLFLL